MSTIPPSEPGPNPGPNLDANNRIDTSLRYHARQALVDVSAELETMTHAVASIDDAMAEVGADDSTDRMRRAVVAARGGLLQLGVALLATER
ncbi:MAG: hypothetical protein DRQ55_20530, partial [Planctomycetota bacterium]